MTVKFLFMDEKYADQAAPPIAQVTCLTGILVPADAHPVFRRQYYRLLSEAIGGSESVIPVLPPIHASNLLPGAEDDVRFAFLEGLIAIAKQLNFRVYRVGYRKTPPLTQMFQGESGIIGLCFSDMLSCLTDELVCSQVWPVMETDRSIKQDQLFSGTIQWLDYLTARLGRSAVSLANDNLGEVFYTTKRSAHGAMADCAAYLLHMGFLRSIGHPQTPYKERLADIADEIKSVLAFNEVIDLKFEPPPAG